jgi:hypothetical protein
MPVLYNPGLVFLDILLVTVEKARWVGVDEEKAYAEENPVLLKRKKRGKFG